MEEEDGRDGGRREGTVACDRMPCHPGCDPMSKTIRGSQPESSRAERPPLSPSFYMASPPTRKAETDTLTNTLNIPSCSHAITVAGQGAASLR